MRTMTAATAAPPATQPAATAAPGGTDATAPAEETGRGWGIVLDIAGILAGLVVAFVVADIWTGGKLSAPFRRREITDDDAAS